eukprot:TRINITY_DN2597_c0_g1_i1.p2 TRINITY_DN2597_c0_g1~~TRINITY_DN2597_c0_g1_i1.p2  ORF type:complete len:577 (-),score=267.94 TRINITY_DN2597_c0_g1_i1:25-1755(-)
MEFTPGDISRNFIEIPRGCTWAEMDLKLESEGDRIFEIRSQQLVHGRAYKEDQFAKRILLSPTEAKTFKLNVVEDVTSEICIAQFWNSLGNSKLKVTMQFHGLSPTDSFHMSASDAVKSVSIMAPVRTCQVLPEISLEFLQQPLVPISSTLGPLLSQRDILPNGSQIYQKIFHYKFKLEESAEITMKIPMLCDLLYENPFEIQMLELSSENRVLLHVDAYPSRYFKKVPKGDYQIRLKLRHVNYDTLDKLKNLQVVVETKLNSKKNLKIYATLDEAMSEESTAKESKLKVGNRKLFFIRNMDPKDVPTAVANSSLVGTFKLNKDMPEGILFTYTGLAQKSEAKKKAENFDEISEFLVSQKLRFLRQLVDKKKFDEFFKISENVPEGVSLETSLKFKRLTLLALDNHPDRSFKLKEIVQVADSILNDIDQVETAAFFGLKADPDDKDHSKLKKKMNLRKKVLVEALFNKGLAMSDLEEKGEVERSQVEQVWKLLSRWADSGKFLELQIRNLINSGQFGSALKIIRKEIDDLGNTSEPARLRCWENLVKVLEKLGWSQWATEFQMAKKLTFPTRLPPL